MRLFRRKPKLDQREIYDWLVRVFNFCDSEARTSALDWLKKTYPNKLDALLQTAHLAACASLCHTMLRCHILPDITGPRIAKQNQLRARVIIPTTKAMSCVRMAGKRNLSLRLQRPPPLILAQVKHWAQT